MIAKLGWFLLGMAVCFVFLKRKEIKALYENRRTIGAAGDAAGALGTLVSSGKKIWDEVT